MKLDITYDVVNKNGDTYPKDVLISALDDAIQDNILIYSGINDEKIPQGPPIGIMHGYLVKDGGIRIIHSMSDELQDNHDISMGGYGIADDNNIAFDMEIKFLYLIPKQHRFMMSYLQLDKINGSTMPGIFVEGSTIQDAFLNASKQFNGNIRIEEK